MTKRTTLKVINAKLPGGVVIDPDNRLGKYILNEAHEPVPCHRTSGSSA